MQPLRVMLAEARSGVLLFGITPPRLSASAEQVREIAAVTRARLASLELDGLVLYDIDDESDRNPAPVSVLADHGPGGIRGKASR